MSEIIKTMKLCIKVSDQDIPKLQEITELYRQACNEVSDYIFNHNFPLSFYTLEEQLYHHIRKSYNLKSQLSQSVIKTVIARYKTVQTQYKNEPYVYINNATEEKFVFERTLEWMEKPINFKRPQADLVRNRDYSFVIDKKSGERLLSLNTLQGRIKVAFTVPNYFNKYFDGTWKFGFGKIVEYKGKWYFHISMTKENDKEFRKDQAKHVVGIDRGLRYIMVTSDENEKVEFYSGEEVAKKRNAFKQVRARLQSKGTKSAKRVLKRISGRENRWMSDVNHCLSKTLTEKFGTDTLFVIEDLTGVSFDDKNLENKTDEQRNELRSWAFYQLEQFLIYKANAIGSSVLKVSPEYTSQRCPICGRIHKENRNHEKHIYTCDACGYSANDDEVAAMNIQQLGALWMSGVNKPSYKQEKQKRTRL